LRFDRALTEIVAPYRDISEDICKEIKQWKITDSIRPK
jgi:hypothetical protein